MIVTAEEAMKRSFLGVDFVVLSRGPKSMVTKMGLPERVHARIER
jgi:hypothetical protein